MKHIGLLPIILKKLIKYIIYYIKYYKIYNKYVFEKYRIKISKIKKIY